MDDELKMYGGGCLLLAIGVFAIYFLLGFHSVDPTQVAIIKTNGTLSVADNGITHIMPGFSSIDFVDTRKQTKDFSEFDAATREQQSVKVSGQVIYHIDRTKVLDLYTKTDLGNIEQNLLDKALQDFIKESTVQYPAADVTTTAVQPDGSVKVTTTEQGILNHRKDIRDHAVTAMQGRLDVNYPGITIDDIYLANLQFSDQYEKAIEAKQQAAQEVETAKQQQAKAQVEANTALIQAQGEANANKARQTGITPEVLQQEAIAKWNGQLPAVSGANGVPFINIPTATASPSPKP